MQCESIEFKIHLKQILWPNSNTYWFQSWDCGNQVLQVLQPPSLKQYFLYRLSKYQRNTIITIIHSLKEKDSFVRGISTKVKQKFSSSIWICFFEFFSTYCVLLQYFWVLGAAEKSAGSKMKETKKKMKNKK